MTRYFKFVALHDKEWLIREFLEGRARFGWSGPGSNLRDIQEKSDRTEEEAVTWKYTQFLILKLEQGDRLICQFDRPLREFWLGEVTSRGYEFDPDERPDFNHIINIQPLSEIGIPLNARYIPASLKHDLTKRGHYYKIYPEESIRCLEQLATDRPWQSALPDQHRSDADEFDENRSDLVTRTIRSIRQRWKATSFETFCAYLCENIDYIELHSKQDNKQGWDLKIRILDPITGEILADEVPVQCKNYDGDVTENRPIEDLKRCIANSDSNIAYLFILGELTKEFRHQLEIEESLLSKVVGYPVTFRVVDQEMIAELYLASLAKDKRLGSTGSTT